MKVKLTLFSFLLVVLGSTAFADQAAYVTKAQADKAAAFLKDKKQIRHYCAPCDDKGDRVEDIADVTAVKVDYQNYWEVQINGKGIDLAYVYFRTKSGKWKNLAKELDIKVHDVPKTLANDLRANMKGRN
jgi:hypothetical protein